MSSSNRVQVAAVREVTPGTTPALPRLRTMRLTGESLTFTPEFVESEELRADRNMGDPIKIIHGSGGGINFELSYPDMLSPMDELLKSAFFSSWVNQPTLFNNGIANSVISDVDPTAGFTVSSTTGIQVGHLMRGTGFTNAGNNIIFRVTAVTATTIDSTSTFVDEANPPGTARLKVVGFQPPSREHVRSATIVAGGSGGVNGPVTITGTTGTGTKFQATGTIVGGALDGALVITEPGTYTAPITDINAEPVTGGSLVGATVSVTVGGATVALSNSLEFHAAPDMATVLVPGQWIKIGGTEAVNRFNNAVTNDWVRVVSIDPRDTARNRQKVNIDHLPAGWQTGAGVDKLIWIFFGDQIRNGVTPNSLTIQKGFLDQTVPTYIVNRGMQVNTCNVTIVNRQKITATVDMMGMSGTQSTTTLDAVPDAATTGAIMAAHANVGRLSEAGSKLTDPNWSSEMSFQINNNLRRVEAVDEIAPVAINAGECTVTGRLVTYFGSNAILQKLYNGTATSLNTRVTKNNQGLIFQFPRVTLRNGVPAASGKNQDVTLASDWSAGLDPVLGCAILMDRVEYFEL